MRVEYSHNVYYNPEKSGLRLLEDRDQSDRDYQFDLLCLWVDEDGVLYMAHDSGCSCPCPFENHSLEDLIVVSSVEDIVEVVNDYSYAHAYNPYDAHDFVLSARSYLS